MAIITLFLLVVFILGLGTLEAFLSTRKNKFYGLIIPAVFFVIMSVFLMINLNDAYTSVEGFGSFLTYYGNTGLFALILKIGFTYSPVLFYLIIYFIARGIYKHNHPNDKQKEIDKMKIEDSL